MMTVPIDLLVPSAEALAAEEARDRRRLKRVSELESSATDLRNEARDLEHEAEELRAEIETERAGGPTLGAIAGWMLRQRRRLSLSPFAAAGLVRAIEQHDVRFLRAVALLYGVALPLDFWPAVPDAARVARVVSATAGLELFGWRRAA